MVSKALTRKALTKSYL